MRIELLVW